MGRRGTGRRSGGSSRSKEIIPLSSPCPDCGNHRTIVKHLSKKPFRGFVYGHYCGNCGEFDEIEGSKAEAPEPKSVTKRRTKKEKAMNSKVENFKTENKYMSEDASTAALSMVSYGISSRSYGVSHHSSNSGRYMGGGRYQYGPYGYGYEDFYEEEYWARRFNVDVDDVPASLGGRSSERTPNFAAEKVRGLMFDGDPDQGVSLVGIVDGRVEDIKVGTYIDDTLGQRGCFKIKAMRRGVSQEFAMKLLESCLNDTEVIDKIKKGTYTLTNTVTVIFSYFISDKDFKKTEKIDDDDTVEIELKDDNDGDGFSCKECDMRAFSSEVALGDTPEDDDLRELIEAVSDEVQWWKYHKNGSIPEDVSLFDALAATGELDGMCLKCRREHLMDLTLDDVANIALEYASLEYLALEGGTD